MRENLAKTSKTINAAHQAKKRRSTCLAETFVRTRFSLAGAVQRLALNPMERSVDTRVNAKDDGYKRERTRTGAMLPQAGNALGRSAPAQ